MGLTLTKILFLFFLYGGDFPIQTISNFIIPTSHCLGRLVSKLFCLLPPLLPFLLFPSVSPSLSVELSSLSLCMTNSKLGEPCFYVIGRTENTRLVMVPVSSPIFCLSTCLYLVFTSHSFLFIVEMIILVLSVEVVVVVCFIHSNTRCILNKAQVTFYVRRIHRSYSSLLKQLSVHHYYALLCYVIHKLHVLFWK